jgi:regulator of protease activity HflC (stomatin/prohibitin superfamily)
VEIAAMVVWRVNDTAQAVFDVEDFERYVETQSETALRHLASSYAYGAQAAMVSNLMVVLCGESEVHPVVNAGTLYT